MTPNASPWLWIVEQQCGGQISKTTLLPGAYPVDWEVGIRIYPFR